MALQKVFVTADVALPNALPSMSSHFVYEEHRLAVRQDLLISSFVHLTYSFPRKNPGTRIFGGAPELFILNNAEQRLVVFDDLPVADANLGISPSISLLISFISFMASMMQSVSPLCTVSPTATNGLLSGDGAA